MLVASIDIGTNTVRCLIGNVTHGVLKPLEIRREIVRIGSGIRTDGGLRPGPVKKLADVLSHFRKMVIESRCQRLWAVGTSAFRETGIHGALVPEAEAALTFPISVISGEEEAALTVDGVQAGAGPLKDGVVVDIGGGSTEIIRVSGGVNAWWSSIPEGVVHLTEELLRDDPPSPRQVAELRDRFQGLLQDERDDGGTEMVGTAGTPTTLAALDLGIDEYDPTLVNGHVLSRHTIDGLRSEFLTLPSTERLKMPGLEKGREDLIVAGVLMIEEIMNRWEYTAMKVSDWGLLEGVALAAAKGRGQEIQ